MRRRLIVIGTVSELDDSAGLLEELGVELLKQPQNDPLSGDMGSTRSIYIASWQSAAELMRSGTWPRPLLACGPRLDDMKTVSLLQSGLDGYILPGGMDELEQLVRNLFR